MIRSILSGIACDQHDRTGELETARTSMSAPPPTGCLLHRGANITWSQLKREDSCRGARRPAVRRDHDGRGRGRRRRDDPCRAGPGRKRLTACRPRAVPHPLPSLDGGAEEALVEPSHRDRQQLHGNRRVGGGGDRGPAGRPRWPLHRRGQRLRHDLRRSMRAAAGRGLVRLLPGYRRAADRRPLACGLDAGERPARSRPG